MLPLNHNNGGPKSTELDLLSPSHGDKFGAGESQRLFAEIDSTYSTPYVSAPSSPGRGPSGYFFSAPASPMHFVISTASYSSSSKPTDFFSTVSGSFEFEFSSKFSPNYSSAGNGSMSSADELFLNGQIRPMKLSSHLLRPQTLAPLMDLEIEYEDEESDNRKDSKCANREDSVTRGRDLRSRNRSLHKKARSMSPLKSAQFQWLDEKAIDGDDASLEVSESKQTGISSTETPPSGSASSSRSSSSGRNSKKWIFLKDLLYRSKSEGRGNNKEKFWSSISFSSGKEKKLVSPSLTPSSSEKEKIGEETERQKRNERVPARKSAPGKPVNGVAKRKVPPSAHELHYSANRAQAEEMKKKTFLPYRQGLLGCLGFSSKGYGAINGLTKTLNPISSREALFGSPHW
ncbi:uncharacterized protein LOC130761496 [Actinidia eriantha]|uniref:uncharacterized protein LOC130761496 n=1 Tax=Actinidia eriantha TaxID=165200 RepID=UPI00258B601C|nr:uncharacterized protein LOC130761496 [Actinidia eriantha]